MAYISSDDWVTAPHAGGSLYLFYALVLFIVPCFMLGCDLIATYRLSPCDYRAGPTRAGRSRLLRGGAVLLGSLAEGDIAAWLCLVAEARRHLQHHAYAFSCIS